DFFSLNVNIGCCALKSSANLVNHDPGVLQDIPLAGRSAGKEDSTHASGLANADGGHIGLNNLHSVVDSQPSTNRATGAVNVEIDIFIRVFLLQEEQLGDN